LVKKVKVLDSDIIKPKNSLRRYLPVAAVAACFVIVLSFVLMFINGNTARKIYMLIVGIDINPSIELWINYNNKIAEAKALNGDAETVLEGLN